MTVRRVDWGPGGDYTWSLDPYTDDPSTSDLEGTFTLTRPDGTQESFDFALPRK